MMTEPSAATPLLSPPSRPARTAPPSGASAFDDLEKRLEARIRERPLVAVFTAFGIGYLLTRLFSRGSR